MVPTNSTHGYLYGKLRTSDFLPVGPDLESEHRERGYDSLSSGDSEGAGLEYAFSEGAGSDSDASLAERKAP